MPSSILKGKQSLIAFFFFSLCFVLTRQLPISFFFPSALSITLFTFVFTFILLEFKTTKFDHRLILLLAYTILILFLSLINSNDLNALPRFLIIIFLINFVLLLPFNKFDLSTAFNISFSIHAVFLIGFEIYLLYFYSGENYTVIRQFFLSNDFGDVYTYSGYFFRIQIIGNALIPFAFMISYFMFRLENGNFFFVAIYFAGCIIAANLMFIITVAIYIFLLELIKSNAKFKKSIKNFSLFLLFILFLPFMIELLYSNILLKLVGGGSSSLGTRFDQAYALMVGLTESYNSIIFGQGLGSKLNVVTSVRDYSSFVYYELQSLYIFYQLGLLGFLLLVALHIYLFLCVCKNIYLILIYCMYIFYAITNPYMFDTSQVVVLIYLISLSKKTDNLNINTVTS
jgi:hypothetical protein